MDGYLALFIPSIFKTWLCTYSNKAIWQKPQNVSCPIGWASDVLSAFLNYILFTLKVSIEFFWNQNELVVIPRSKIHKWETFVLDGLVMTRLGIKSFYFVLDTHTAHICIYVRMCIYTRKEVQGL